MKKKYILVTGCAGFIGMHYSIKLLNSGHNVIGIDNLNNYYSKKLKIARLRKLKKYVKFKFFQSDINNLNNLKKIIKNKKFNYVFHFAAQAGVRYSLIDPYSYINTNIVGLVNLLECFKNEKIKQFIFASSSSVYGRNKKQPYDESQRTDQPKSLYAATKKSGEIIAEYYSFYFDMKITALRFFTVYGPWGRPDMSLFKFVDLIKQNKRIDIFNNGQMSRSFTYIDDITESIFRLMNSKKNYKLNKLNILNIGGDKKINLNYFISIIEKEMKTKIKKNYLPMIKADVKETFSNNKKLKSLTKFEPNQSIKKGIKEFINWHDEYYSK
tara:strand:- start:174 stop:1151 length:978 start_codon:yes stop_codon:yes gene_type:complete